MDFAYVADHYFKAQQVAQGILKDWDVHRYLQFLINSQLIEYKDAATMSIAIAAKGKAFISYLLKMNYKKYGI